MKRILFLFAAMAQFATLGHSQGTTVTEASVAQVTAGTVGAGYYVSPRRMVNGTVGNATTLQGYTPETLPVSTATQAALETKSPLDPRMRWTLRKLARMTSDSPQQIRFLTFSDSMNGLGAESAFTVFARQLGYAYGDLSAGVSPTLGVTGSAYAGDGTASGSDASYTRWPTGGIPWIETGGTISYGRGGATAYADTLKVYYIKESGAGTFKVQTSTDFSSWSDEAGYTNVSAADSTMSLGIITIPKTAAGYGLRVVGLTGRVYFLPNGTGQFRCNGINGVEVASVAIGGLDLARANMSSALVFQAWLADYAPDLGFWEMKESAATLVTTLPDWWTRVSGGQPNMDWCIIGSTPIQTGDADQVAQNEIARTLTEDHGLYFLDLHALFGGSWSLANSQGFMADGVHRTNAGNVFATSAYLRSLRLFDHPYGIVPYGVNTAQEITSSSKLAVAIPSGLSRAGYPDLVGIHERSGTSGQDAEIYANRTLYFQGVGGAAGTALINLTGVGNSGIPYAHFQMPVGVGADAFFHRLSAGRLRLSQSSSNGSSGPIATITANIWVGTDGTNSAPSLTWDNRQNSGFYWDTGTSGVSISVAGTKRGGWSSSGYTGEVVNTPAGNIAATTMQGAINELDTEKFPYAGVTNGGNATAGNVGEYIESKVASGSAVSLTTATGANVTSIALTAGDWDVSGCVNLSGATATFTSRSAGISTTSATVPADGTEVTNTTGTSTATITIPLSPSSKRISVSGSTTVYLVTNSTFSIGTASAYGVISARRVR